MSEGIKALLDLVSILGKGEDPEKEDPKKEDPKENLTFTKEDLEKAQRDAVEAHKLAVAAAGGSPKKEDPDSGEKDAEDLDDDGVIDYESEFKAQQDDLILTKVNTGLNSKGVDLDFAEIHQYFSLDSLKDEKGRPVQEKIDELVNSMAHVATKTPPRGKKRVERKPGMAAYLDEA